MTFGFVFWSYLCLTTTYSPAHLIVISMAMTATNEKALVISAVSIMCSSCKASFPAGILLIDVFVCVCACAFVCLLLLGERPKR